MKIKSDLPTYKSMLKVTSIGLRDKLMAFLTENNYRTSKRYKFTLEELETITGIKVVWWTNWKRQSVPAHVILMLHINFDIDLQEFFATGELKKISREGRENVCA